MNPGAHLADAFRTLGRAGLARNSRTTFAITRVQRYKVDVRYEGGSSGEAKAWDNGTEDRKAKHPGGGGAEDDGTREHCEANGCAQVRRRPVVEVRGKVIGAARSGKEDREAIDQ